MAAVLVVGALGVGTASLVDRPAQLDIADQPPASSPAPTEGQDGTSTPIDEPVITRPPALTVSSREPFAWVVTVSAGDGGRWCVTAARGTIEITDHVVVELTDGTRWSAHLASGDAVDATLWAIGYEEGEVHAVEAQGEGWAVGTVALEDGWTVADMLLVLGGLAAIVAVVAAARWRITRRNA